MSAWLMPDGVQSWMVFLLAMAPIMAAVLYLSGLSGRLAGVEDCLRHSSWHQRGSQWGQKLGWRAVRARLGGLVVVFCSTAVVSGLVLAGLQWRAVERLRGWLADPQVQVVLVPGALSSDGVRAPTQVAVRRQSPPDSVTGIGRDGLVVLQDAPQILGVVTPSHPLYQRVYPALGAQLAARAVRATPSGTSATQIEAWSSARVRALTWSEWVRFAEITGWDLVVGAGVAVGTIGALLIMLVLATEGGLFALAVPSPVRLPLVVAVGAGWMVLGAWGTWGVVRERLAYSSDVIALLASPTSTLTVSESPEGPVVRLASMQRLVRIDTLQVGQAVVLDSVLAGPPTVALTARQVRHAVELVPAITGRSLAPHVGLALAAGARPAP